MKKIIKMACAEIITLNAWWLLFKYWAPGADNSIRINTLNAVPSNPEKMENTKYIVPISFADVEYNHLKNEGVYILFH